jgi:chromosome segregation ATPase
MSVSNRTTRSTQSSQKSFTEVIEIFSSDDDDSGPNHSGISDQIGQLKQAVLSLTQKCSDLQTAEEEASVELKRAQKEIVELKLGLERVASARALVRDTCTSNLHRSR